MNVVVSVAEHEIEMAHRWFDFVCELCGTDGHSLFLIPAAGVNITDILPKAQKAFSGRVSIIKDEEGETSNWQITDPIRSASGPNSAFRQVAWYFHHAKIGPWFWCELDCIPTKREFLDRLEAEYKIAVANGKVIVGAHVMIEYVPEHCSGNAIYPESVPTEAPTLTMRTNWIPRGQTEEYELAFDIAGAAEVIPKAHWTNLIQHKFRYEGFKSRAEFDAVIDPSAVVFHSDKKGTIYQYLRENLSGGVESRHAHQDEKGSSARDRANAVPDQLNDGHSGSSAPPAQTTLDKKRAALVKARAARAAKVEAAIARQDATEKFAPTVQPVGATKTRTFAASDELQREIIARDLEALPSELPTMSEPWKNKADSEREVKLLCETLALFAKAPRYKARVRQALREAKIIK